MYDNGNCQACYTYNPDGTMKALEIGGNSGEGILYTEYSYDRDKNLTGLKTLVRQGALTGRYGLLTDNHYSYDRAGNCVIRQTLSGETRYSYDSLYQLTEASCPNKKEQFTYDGAGNRLTRTVARTHGDTVREAYTYDNANRLTRRSIYNMTAGAQEIPETPEMADRMYRYTYDRQGNMLSDGDNTYQYDGMNRLKEINTKAGDIQKNHYDGEGLRAELEENGKLVSFLYSDGEAVLEDSEAAGITRYIRGLGLLTSDSESARTYYHYASDDLGSITHITDEEGNVLNRYEYDAFGNFTVKEETIQNRFAFTGEQYDPITSQYYLRARFYNPVIGRFLNEDTYYGDGLNLYTYCHNNPVYYIDPSGYDGICPKKFQKYKKQGYSDKEAYIKAKAEFIKKQGGDAEAYLNAQINKLNKNGYSFSTKWKNKYKSTSKGRIGNKVKRPGGYKAGDVDHYGLLSPEKNRAIGNTNQASDHYVQAHHPIQDQWAKLNVSGYNSKKAPAILLKSSSGMEHAKLSAMQRERRSKYGYNTTIRQEFNVSYAEMRRAGVSKKDSRKAIRQAYKYFDGLGAF